MDENIVANWENKTIGAQRDIIDCLLHGSPTKHYEETVRRFALTLHFHSPRAYKYVRNKFDDHLPHPSTISKWYLNSDASGKPGLCAVSLQKLKQLATTEHSNGSELLCSLMFDEMSIRKHLQWSDSEKKFIGRITHGFRPDGQAVPLASNALTFMLNGINCDFTLPIAHYLIRCLKAEEKAKLVTDVINAISACGVRVLSITFDGLCINFKMCKTLGASFSPKNVKPFFYLHGDTRKTFIILDPSHMLKLARNLIGNASVLTDETGGQIEWSYFEKLEEFRVHRGFTLAHKMNKRHMHWKNFAMNVQVAAQTMSNSVANSMQHLMDAKHEEFSNAYATFRSIKYVNNVFDISNSLSKKPSTFKSPINPLTATEIFAYCDKANVYFRNIKLLDGTYVRKSRKATVFQGFEINLASFKLMYEEIVATMVMNCLPTRKLSQDYLESFFGRIRSLLGSNDNPTVQQFCAAFRKAIVNNDIVSSEGANCQDVLRLNILSVSARRSKSNANENELLENHEFEETKTDSETAHTGDDNLVLNDLEIASISHQAGLIETKIFEQARFSCADCCGVFSQNDKVTHSFGSIQKHIPCQTTFDICCIAAKYIPKLVNDSAYSYQDLFRDIMSSICLDNAFPRSNFAEHQDHKEYFVTFIAEEFIRTQTVYAARNSTLQEQEKLLGNRVKKLRQAFGQ